MRLSVYFHLLGLVLNTTQIWWWSSLGFFFVFISPSVSCVCVSSIKYQKFAYIVATVAVVIQNEKKTFFYWILRFYDGGVRSNEENENSTKTKN